MTEKKSEATLQGVLDALPAATANRTQRGDVRPDRAALVSRLMADDE